MGMVGSGGIEPLGGRSGQRTRFLAHARMPSTTSGVHWPPGPARLSRAARSKFATRMAMSSAVGEATKLSMAPVQASLLNAIS